MKKRLFTFVAVASFAFVALVGCSDQNVDTAKLRAALQSLDGAQKAQLELALSDIDSGKYKEAVLPLRKIGFGAKLTKEQAKILQDTMTKVQAKAAKE